MDKKKSGLKWFEHVMRMREERISKKMPHINWGKRPRTTITNWIDQIRKHIEMIGGNSREIQENRKWVNRDGCRFLCNKSPILLEMTYERWRVLYQK